MTRKVDKSEAEWRAQLTPEQYAVTRKAGTERPYSGRFYMHEGRGSYHCVCCDAELFESEEKFHSGCGWPAFSAAKPGTIEYIEDRSHGMVRTEVRCKACGAHLGHVFDDGPGPTGRRYCINSVCLTFDGEPG